MENLLKAAEMQNREQARAEQGLTETKEKETTGSEGSKGGATGSSRDCWGVRKPAGHTKRAASTHWQLRHSTLTKGLCLGKGSAMEI